MDSEFKYGAVCFAGGEQWFVNHLGDDKRYQLKNFSGGSFYSFYGVINFAKHFQLNTIKKGDYIEASELDTEQKYNDAVEVFGLFGLECHASYSLLKSYGNLYVESGTEVYACTDESESVERKITYNQLMAIGELKRMMNGRDKSAPKTALDLTPGIEIKTSKDYLNECIEVQNQRGEQYDSKGTGERSFAAAASAFNAMTGQNLKGSDVCLLLACVKAVRQYSDTTRVHEDSLLDLVSYASLWAEELNKEAK